MLSRSSRGGRMGSPCPLWRVVTVGLSAIVPLARMYVAAHLSIDIVGGSFLGLAMASASGDPSRQSERRPATQWCVVARENATEVRKPIGNALACTTPADRQLDRRRGQAPRYRQNVLHVVREPISSRFYDLPNRASARYPV
jgi:hypothetical protein